MIKIENVQIFGWGPAIRGMRNPMNSWDKMDSIFSNGFLMGPNDYELMMKLAKAGSVHAKYRRMIQVYVDVIAPFYWWKEMDTYMVGKNQNSCSTMHKIHEKEFTIEDFSNEHLDQGSMLKLNDIIDHLNLYRRLFINTGEKRDWWNIIQLLPSSYNQRRTVNLNYETLSNIYQNRKEHKLDEWRDFCRWIESLPYSQVITLKED